MSAQQLADRALLNLGRGLKEHGYRFITPTPLTHERVYQRLPTPLAVDLRDVFGWSMPFDNQLLPEAFREELQQADVIEKHDALWRSAVRWSSLDDLLLAHSAYPTTQSDAVFLDRTATASRTCSKPICNSAASRSPAPWTSAAAPVSAHWWSPVRGPTPRCWQWTSTRVPCASRR